MKKISFFITLLISLFLISCQSNPIKAITFIKKPQSFYQLSDQIVDAQIKITFINDTEKIFDLADYKQYNLQVTGNTFDSYGYHILSISYGNIKLTYQYCVIDQTFITLDDNGGFNGSCFIDLSTIDNSINQKINLAIPYKNDYCFIGYFDSNDNIYLNHHLQLVKPLDNNYPPTLFAKWVPISSDLIFTLEDDNTYSVKLDPNANPTTIYIPSHYNDLLVTKITADQLIDFPNLTTVIIPLSIVEVSEMAFKKATRFIDNNLIIVDDWVISYLDQDPSNDIDLSIYPKLIGIAKQSFAFSNINSITLSSSIKYLNDSAFNCCSNLSTVSISPNSKLEIIGNSTFYNCSNLSTISLPSSLTTIGNSAFSNCTSIITLTLPYSIKYLGSMVFYNWQSNQIIYCRALTYNWDEYWDYLSSATIIYQNT